MTAELLMVLALVCQGASISTQKKCVVEIVDCLGNPNLKSSAKEVRDCLDKTK